jgi:hypothetical protein
LTQSAQMRMAMTVIAKGGHEVQDVAHLPWVRAVDTVIGCV